MYITLQLQYYFFLLLIRQFIISYYFYYFNHLNLSLIFQLNFLNLENFFIRNFHLGKVLKSFAVIIIFSLVKWMIQNYLKLNFGIIFWWIFFFVFTLFLLVFTRFLYYQAQNIFHLKLFFIIINFTFFFIYFFINVCLHYIFILKIITLRSYFYQV